MSSSEHLKYHLMWALKLFYDMWEFFKIDTIRNLNWGNWNGNITLLPNTDPGDAAAAF